MPLNYKIIESRGVNCDTFRKLFTCGNKPGRTDSPSNTAEAKDPLNEKRVRIEDIIASRIDEGVLASLKASHFIAAVDLAWDSSTITKKTIPLQMYAQGRIDTEACKKTLAELGCADQYVKRSESTKKEYLDLPKFLEVNVNLVRSVITRRVAAQSARYTNLYPYYKYEPRGTGEGDKLRGDLMSQRTDVMTDQFGYRWQGVQEIRDMLMYPHAVEFPRCVWDREVEWYDKNDDIADELRTKDPQIDVRVKREGVPFTIPHPSRVFYDTNHPIQSINSDTGCEWFGFWDVVRYSYIYDNPDFFNKDVIGIHPDQAGLFYTHSAYFSQYYTTITPPEEWRTLATANDRVANVSPYTVSMRDTPVFLTHLYWKLKPNEWCLGEYPYDLWFHFTVANSRTVVHCEVMPDCPAAVFAFNGSNQRLNNLSMAHELLTWQDQVTNLYTELLQAVKRDLFQVAVLNHDALPVENEESKKVLESFRAAMRSENFWSSTNVLECSLIKMRDIGADMDKVFKVVQMPPNTKITEIIQAIAQTFHLAERVMAMSANEQAQMAPRETSATEAQLVGVATENLYTFISDAIDEGRAAKKRYIYNAFMSKASDNIYLPVIKRYRKEVAMRAGFDVVDEEENADITAPRSFMARGLKRSLMAEYVFSSRDGAERTSNVQASQILVNLLTMLLQPGVAQLLTQENLTDIINAIIRLSGSGVDIIVEPQGGAGSPLQIQQQGGSPPAPAPVGMPSAPLA